MRHHFLTIVVLSAMVCLAMPANLNAQYRRARPASGRDAASSIDRGFDGSRDAELRKNREWDVKVPCSRTETRYHTQMVGSLNDNKVGSRTVPHEVVVHFAEMGQIRAKFVGLKGTTVTLLYESGSLPSQRSVNYRKGVEYKFQISAFSREDRAFFQWVKETAKKKNAKGLFELNALSNVGTEGVLTGEIKLVKAINSETALMRQVYDTDAGTISWDFTLKIPTKDIPETFPGLFKVTSKDVVERSENESQPVKRTHLGG